MRSRSHGKDNTRTTHTVSTASHNGPLASRHYACQYWCLNQWWTLNQRIIGKVCLILFNQACSVGRLPPNPPDTPEPLSAEMQEAVSPETASLHLVKPIPESIFIETRRACKDQIARRGILLKRPAVLQNAFLPLSVFAVGWFRLRRHGFVTPAIPNVVLIGANIPCRFYE